MYKELSIEEEQEYREFVRQHPNIIETMKLIELWHPVCKDEMIKMLGGK
jgi:hypothetical protein